MSTANPARPSFIASFSKSQVAAFAATLADYILLFSLVEIFHVWYVLATALGALLGAIVNFIINRYWSFEATHRRWHGQAWKYALVSAGSLLLNSGGVYAMTELGRIHYAISVVAVSLIVAWVFNYPLQRHFVFR